MSDPIWKSNVQGWWVGRTQEVNVPLDQEHETVVRDHPELFGGPKTSEDDLGSSGFRNDWSRVRVALPGWGQMDFPQANQFWLDRLQRFMMAHDLKVTAVSIYTPTGSILATWDDFIHARSIGELRQLAKRHRVSARTERVTKLISSLPPSQDRQRGDSSRGLRAVDGKLRRNWNKSEEKSRTRTI